MKKINNWLDKPWTNRTYCRLSFWSILISLLISLITLKRIARKCEIEDNVEVKPKAKNENSLFDEVQSKDFRL